MAITTYTELKTAIADWLLRDDLTADWAIRILRVDQVKEVRRDRHRKLVAGEQHACAFLLAEFNVLLEGTE